MRELLQILGTVGRDVRDQSRSRPPEPGLGPKKLYFTGTGKKLPGPTLESEAI
jgi:hypothetical protein